MPANDRRAHQRYPAWFPINIRIDGREGSYPAMLCDVSVGGALVWVFLADCPADAVHLDIHFRTETFELPARVVSIERQWDTVILHLQFAEKLAAGSPRLVELISELRGHFEAYQVYLSHRADDDPALGRTITQYPDGRASA